MIIDYRAIGVVTTVVIITTGSSIKIPAWIIVFVITLCVILSNATFSGYTWLHSSRVCCIDQSLQNISKSSGDKPMWWTSIFFCNFWRYLTYLHMSDLVMYNLPMFDFPWHTCLPKNWTSIMEANTKFSDIYPQLFGAEQVTCLVQTNLRVNIIEFFFS